MTNAVWLAWVSTVGWWALAVGLASVTLLAVAGLGVLVERTVERRCTRPGYIRREGEPS